MLLFKFRCSIQRQTEGPNAGAFKDSDLANYLMNAFVITIWCLAKIDVFFQDFPPRCSFWCSWYTFDYASARDHGY